MNILKIKANNIKLGFISKILIYSLSLLTLYRFIFFPSSRLWACLPLLFVAYRYGNKSHSNSQLKIEEVKKQAETQANILRKKMEEIQKLLNKSNDKAKISDENFIKSSETIKKLQKSLRSIEAYLQKKASLPQRKRS